MFLLWRKFSIFQNSGRWLEAPRNDQLLTYSSIPWTEVSVCLKRKLCHLLSLGVWESLTVFPIISNACLRPLFTSRLISDLHPFIISAPFCLTISLHPFIISPTPFTRLYSLYNQYFLLVLSSHRSVLSLSTLSLYSNFTCSVPIFLPTFSSLYLLIADSSLRPFCFLQLY